MDSTVKDLTPYTISNKIPKFTALHIKETMKIPTMFLPTSVDRINGALVYAIWSNPLYEYFLYYSLLSYYFYTDMRNVDVIIFTSTQHKQTSPMLEEISKIFPNVKIIEEVEFDVFWNEKFGYQSHKRLLKYTITNHPEIQQYDFVFMSDTDTFVVGEKPRDIFAETFEYYTKGGRSVHMYEDYISTVFSTLRSRRIGLGNTFLSDEELIEFMENRLEAPDSFFTYVKEVSNPWYVSFVHIYNPKIHYNDEKWEYFTQYMADEQFFCDETVYIAYCQAKNIKIRDFTELFKKSALHPPAEEPEYLHAPPEGLDFEAANFFIQHPLTGGWTEDNAELTAQYFSHLENLLEKL